MADTPEVNLASFHVAIRSALAAEFPLATVEYYSRPGEKAASPGINFELESIEPADPDDIGTDQFECVIRLAAYCVRDYKKSDETRAKMAVRSMAVNVARFIRGNSWGQPATQAVITGIFPDTFEGTSDAYEVQRIEWEHRCFIGESVWDDDGETPAEVYVSEPESRRIDNTLAAPLPAPEEDATPGLPVSEL